MQSLLFRLLLVSSFLQYWEEGSFLKVKYGDRTPPAFPQPPTKDLPLHVSCQ